MIFIEQMTDYVFFMPGKSHFESNLQGSKDKSTLVEAEFKMLQKLGLPRQGPDTDSRIFVNDFFSLDNRGLDLNQS